MMKTRMAEDQLRFPDGMRDLLKQKAAQDGRSMNAESRYGAGKDDPRRPKSSTVDAQGRPTGRTSRPVSRREFPGAAGISSPTIFQQLTYDTRCAALHASTH